MDAESTAILQRLGAKIRYYREVKKLSQEEVSFGAGIHRTYLSQIELGERNPSFLVLVRICQTLGVALPDLITEALHEINPQ